MSTWPAPAIRTDIEFEEAFSLFVHLEEEASTRFSPDACLVLRDAFDEFTAHGGDQVAQLFDPYVHDDPQVALCALERRLAQLVSNATNLTHALRYTRALDLIRIISCSELQ